MTPEQIVLTMIRGTIASMPTADQDAIRVATEELRTVITSLGEHGQVALTLLGAELAAAE